MTDRTSTNTSIKNKKAHQHKNLILIFGICISLIVISSYFPFLGNRLANGFKSYENATEIPALPTGRHETDTTLWLNHNRKIHHNFLSSYLLQESGLERKAHPNTDRKGIFSELGNRFTIPFIKLFDF